VYAADSSEETRAEREQEREHPARAALLAYMADHHEWSKGWRDSWSDLTCDEMGCAICNGDSDEETADYWLASDSRLPDLSDYGYEETPGA
jgi:hypothetical protein